MVAVFTVVGILLALALAYFLWRYTLKRPARKPQEPQAEGEPPYTLPSAYGDDELVALVKDPYWLYAYWEVTEGKKAWFEACYGRESWECSEPLLRVYALAPGGESKNLLDIPINDSSNSWYIRVGSPDTTMVLDLGRRLPDQSFVTLLRSNLVTTPPDRVSDLIDPLWPPIEAIWETFRRTGRIKGLPGTISSEELFRQTRPKE